MKRLLPKLIKNDTFLVVVLVLAWQLSLLVLGVLAETIIQPNAGTISQHSITSHTDRWDAGWIHDIPKDWYHHNAASAAFYPLFPATASLVSKVSLGFLTVVESGLLVNVVASIFAAIAIFKIASELFTQRLAGWFAVLLFLSYPAAFFMHMFYSEALFCALGFWAYYFALKRRWALSSLSLAFLTASRITAFLFIILCALEFLRSNSWNIKKSFRPPLLWFLITPLGFISYGLYLLKARGDFFGMLSAYKATSDWSYQIFNPNVFVTIYHAVKTSVKIILHKVPLDNTTLVNVLLPTAALLLLILASLYTIIRIRNWGIPIGIFGLCNALFFTLNSNTVSIHRYVLPCFGVYIATIHLLFHKNRFSDPKRLVGLVTLVFLGGMLQTFLMVLFVSGYFAG